jgi:hypothetical protein
MRFSGDKIILAISCLIFLMSCWMISFVAYFLCFVATAVHAGVAGIGESVAIAILYLLGAILLVCIAIAFMLNSPLDFVRFLLQFLACPGA